LRVLIREILEDVASCYFAMQGRGCTENVISRSAHRNDKFGF